LLFSAPALALAVALAPTIAVATPAARLATSKACSTGRQHPRRQRVGRMVSACGQKTSRSKTPMAKRLLHCEVIECDKPLVAMLIDLADFRHCRLTRPTLHVKVRDEKPTSNQTLAACDRSLQAARVAAE